MGIVVRQSVISSIISYLGVVIGYVNLLYLYPRFLELEQVGLLRTIQDAAILFAPFAQMGVAQSLIRFYPQFDDGGRASRSFLSLMLLLAGVGFILFVAIFWLFQAAFLDYFQENASAIGNYAVLIMWLTLILLLQSVFEAYSRSLLKTILPNLLRDIVVRLLFGLLVLCYFWGWLSFPQFIISTVVANALAVGVLMVALVRTKKLFLQFDFGAIGRPQVRTIVRYSILTFAGTAGAIIVGKIDSMMVAGLLGLAANGIYTTAFYMATVIEIPKRALSQIAMPLISRAFEKKDLPDVLTIYQKTALNQLIVGSLLLIGVWANLDTLFALMPKGSEYAVGKYVVLLVGAGKLVDMFFGPSSEIIVLSRYYAFNILLILLLAGLVIVLNNVFIPLYGIEGAALSTAITLAAFNLVKYVFIWWRLGLQPFAPATAKVLLIAAFTVGLNLLLPTLPWKLLDIVYRSGVISLFFSSLILMSRVSPEANDLFKKGLRLIPFLQK
jgi:O-antigen/teichoic acid export membrane protein